MSDTLPPELSSWLIVVPARLASTRLPRKPLADLGGLPLVVRVAQNLAPLAERGATVLVATDAEEVQAACHRYGVTATMTRTDHESGTDRVAEAVQGYPQPFVMNVQGDEPFVDLGDLLALARAMETRADADMGTLVHAASDPQLALDPNVVKAVRSSQGWALYFSRAPVPYDRTATERQHVPASFWQHVGVYAFRRAQLEAFVKLPSAALERTEKLEQLRALDHGWRIHLEPARHFARGIDTPRDLEAARAQLQNS